MDCVGLFIEQAMFELKNIAGFYPVNKKSIHELSNLYRKASSLIDILIMICMSSSIEEVYRLYSPHAILVSWEMMDPFWSDISWTYALRDKRVLVIHPYAELIQKQYRKRRKLFKSKSILPDMDLITYPAVQSMGGSKFPTWFDALGKMKKDICQIEFDIALLGCGAYGMPLGAFIKSDLKKQAIHLGGSLQLLFGIKGKCWEDEFGYDKLLYNDYWVRPTEDLRPKNYKEAEGGCYW